MRRGDADCSSAGVDMEAGTSNGMAEEEEEDDKEEDEEDAAAVLAVAALALALAKNLGVEDEVGTAAVGSVGTVLALCGSFVVTVDGCACEPPVRVDDAARALG